MVKHTQTVRGLWANELFECVWPLCGAGPERVKGFFLKNFIMHVWQVLNTPLKFPISFCAAFYGYSEFELETFQLLISDALRDLVPFVQFKKCEKHPWRSVTFSKVVDF